MRRNITYNRRQVFDNYLRAKDRVGFIRFSTNCDILFALSDPKKNTIQLRKQIESSTKPFGGTALYNGIYESLKLFHKARNFSFAFVHLSHLNPYVIKLAQTANSKWIIALTDGDDNDSRITYEEILKKL